MEENIREDIDASAKTVFHLKKIYSFLFIEGFIGVRVVLTDPTKVLLTAKFCLVRQVGSVLANERLLRMT